MESGEAPSEPRFADRAGQITIRVYILKDNDKDDETSTTRREDEVEDEHEHEHD